MGFSNGPPGWSEMERVLSGKPRRSGTPTVWTPADEAPWSRKRMAYQPPEDGRPMRSSVAYAELHAHSAYSFLDGASAPEELVEEAVRLDLRAIALTDHNGLYGAVRFAEAAVELDMRTVFGAMPNCRWDPAPGPTIPIRRARTCWCWLAGRKGIGGCRGSWPRRIWPVARKASCASTSMRSPTRRAGTGTS